MKHPVLGKEAIWTRSENEQDTLSQVILRKKITIHSGGELNGYSHLLKHHTQAGKQLKQLIHKREVSDLCIHIKNMWKVTHDSAKYFCAGKRWDLAAGRSSEECMWCPIIWACRTSPVSLLLQKVNGKMGKVFDVCACWPTRWRQQGLGVTRDGAESGGEALPRLAHDCWV